MTKYRRANDRKAVFRRNTTCKNNLSSLTSTRKKGDKTLAEARNGVEQWIKQPHGIGSKSQKKAISKLTSMGKEE